jgi:hypothetical protein
VCLDLGFGEPWVRSAGAKKTIRSRQFRSDLADCVQKEMT